MNLERQLLELLEEQKREWALCGANFAALDGVLEREMIVGGGRVVVQCNPERVRSSSANISKEAIARRPCFLCAGNRPKEQRFVAWRRYECLVNPFPIFSRHYTIASASHEPQCLNSVLEDMTALAGLLPRHFVFYNGPRCGASAPDHLHLQVGVPEELPFDWDNPERCYHIAASEPLLAALRTRLLIRELKEKGSDAEEPMVNVMARSLGGQLHVYLFHRRAFRPWQYTAEEPQRLLVSPATAEVAGLVITPSMEHFSRITEHDIESIFSQCIQDPEPRVPTVSVGICPVDGCSLTTDGDGLAVLDNVTIGRAFHWQQNMALRFEGAMRMADTENGMWYVNDIDVEKYLCSVISSEMSPTAPVELLKAHAVISRTWLMHALLGTPCSAAVLQRSGLSSCSAASHIKIYERDAHTGFDVCADDHCQRYQGVHDNLNAAVCDAVAATHGMVLTSEGAVCDARFSKCCGGQTEIFSTCWADTDYPYLVSKQDPYCDPGKYPLDTFSLNGYDRPTADYYRWEVTLSGRDIQRFVKEKTGMDIGEVRGLEALERGPSGRIKVLRIKGARETLDVGKELEIRRLMSPTHLYSSAFEVEKTETNQGVIFRLHGRGWGHGVGLCQIGAANMAAQGFTFSQILQFYYPNTSLTQLYTR